MPKGYFFPAHPGDSSKPFPTSSRHSMNKRTPIIISCALTGAGDTRPKNPGVPVTPREIADQAIDAARAGASIVHIHVRDPESGKPSTKFAYYDEVVQRIRESRCDVLINLTTGPGTMLTVPPMYGRSTAGMSMPPSSRW